MCAVLRHLRGHKEWRPRNSEYMELGFLNADKYLGSSNNSDGGLAAAEHTMSVSKNTIRWITSVSTNPLLKFFNFFFLLRSFLSKSRILLWRSAGKYNSCDSQLFRLYLTFAERLEMTDNWMSVGLNGNSWSLK